MIEWLPAARRVPSPNCNERPQNTVVSLLVIHNISLPPGEFGGGYIDQLFCNQLDPNEHPYFATIHAAQVSAHLLIRRNGEVVQYVPFTKRAWHAGVSSFDGRENCNDYSIGIELEGSDDVPYEATQYEQLVTISKMLMAEFPAITKARIVGHSDVAPSRKTDPGAAFDWAYYRSQI